MILPRPAGAQHSGLRHRGPGPRPLRTHQARDPAAADRRISKVELRSKLGPASRLPFRQRQPRLPPRPRHRSRSPDRIAEPPRPAVSVPIVQGTAPQPAAARQDFEEKLGARWAVWVGGVALALGGIFLVRYSIEQNLLSPATRIALGGLFALALIGAGEWLRRREQDVVLPRHPQRERAQRSSPQPEPAAPSPRPMQPTRSTI